MLPLFFFSKRNRFYCSPEYDRLLFTMVDRLQKLNLDENERNLLKLVGFFDNGKFSEDRHLLYHRNCEMIGNILINLDFDPVTSMLKFSSS